MTAKIAFFHEILPVFTYGLTYETEMIQVGVEACGFNEGMQNYVFGQKDSNNQNRKMNQLQINIRCPSHPDPKVQFIRSAYHNQSGIRIFIPAQHGVKFIATYYRP